MRIELKRYLKDEMRYEVSNSPIKKYEQSFDIGYRTLNGVDGFVRVISENMILSEVNSRATAIKRALTELNYLAKKSNKYRFCLAIINRPDNMEIVKQHMHLIELNMEVFFIEGERVGELDAILIEEGNKEHSFLHRKHI